MHQTLGFWGANGGISAWRTRACEGIGDASLRYFVSRMPEGVRFAALVHLNEPHIHIHNLTGTIANLK